MNYPVFKLGKYKRKPRYGCCIVTHFDSRLSLRQAFYVITIPFAKLLHCALSAPMSYIKIRQVIESKPNNVKINSL